MRPKLPDSFKQGPGLFSITFIQTQYLPGAFTVHWRLGRAQVRLRAEGHRRHGGIRGDRGRARRRWVGRLLQKRAVCARVCARVARTGRRNRKPSCRRGGMAGWSLQISDVFLACSLGQGLGRPGGLAAFCQNGQELFYAGRGVREVQPEGAAGGQQQRLQQGHVGEEA